MQIQKGKDIERLFKEDLKIDVKKYNEKSKEQIIEELEKIIIESEEYAEEDPYNTKILFVIITIGGYLPCDTDISWKEKAEMDGVTFPGECTNETNYHGQFMITSLGEPICIAERIIGVVEKNKQAHILILDDCEISVP